MKRSSPFFRCKFILPVLVGLWMSFIPIQTYAFVFYTCVDKDGHETLSDSPLEDQACTQVQTYEKATVEQEGKKTITSPDDKVTKIILSANRILVPVTLVYDGNEVDVHLMMDTGASGTMISASIADQLYINLSKAKKAKGEVVGGGIVEARVIRMNILKIGPHRFNNRDVFVVPHEGAAVKHDGLLGMDLLRELKYRVDFDKQVIIWE